MNSGLTEPLLGAPGKFCELKHGPCHYIYDVCEHPVTEATTVLVHGFVGSHLYFGALAERLARHRNVLRYDNIGRGFTPASRGVKMTTQLFVDQLHELLEKLGEAHVDLLGYSMGGGIALSFASQYPEKVRNLCLVAPVGFPSMRKVLPRYVPWILRIPGVSSVVGWAVVRAFSDPRRYGAEWTLQTPDDKRRLKELHDLELQRFPRERTSMGRSAANSLRWFSWGELGHEVSAFKGPALVLWGSVDRTVPEATSEAQVALPQAKMLVEPGHGHAVLLERPDLVAGAFEALTQQPLGSRL